MIKDPFDALLQTDTLDALRSDVVNAKHSFGPVQVQKLLAHARTLSPQREELRISVVHTYTSDLLDPWLQLTAALHGMEANIHHAPYGLAVQEASAGSALVAHRPDVTLMLLRREDLHPALAGPVAGLDNAEQAAVRDQALRQLQELVSMFRAQPLGHLVVTVLPRLTPPTLGLYDLQFGRGEGAWWSTFKADAATWLRDHVSSALYLDLDEVMVEVGRSGFFDRRYWYSATYPFAPAAALEFSRRVAAVAVALRAPRAKVIVLDADNTLWGGIVGEDGPSGIALGPEYPGRVFVDFQRRLLDFQQRGFLLAMCSKNNEADVLEVLRGHPHQVLRESHFAARRINWVPKPDNLASLADELNLGLDSFVFVDDSDHECAAVRHRWPQVQVVQVPKRAVDVPHCLDTLPRLEVLSLTREDLAKTRMYAEERQRRALSEDVSRGGGGATDYLARLGMKMAVHIDLRAHVARLSQLSGKTNQFNLTTRRYTERQIDAFMQDQSVVVADFSLADAFGDSGIVGLAIWRLLGSTEAELDTFLMSCRVIGREAEAAFLHALLRELHARGIATVVADYLPTPKNALVKDFLPSNGFVADRQGRFRLDLLVTPPRPASDFPIAVDLSQPITN